MTHCTRGRELLLETQRAEWLPHYDEEGIRSVLKEMNEMWNALEGLHEGEDEQDNSD